MTKTLCDTCGKDAPYHLVGRDLIQDLLKKEDACEEHLSARLAALLTEPKTVAEVTRG